ncbi:MAG TPA: GIY-YIG nuclease family protein [Candidatus Acidoferrales bacterium]|nr:GIY-YIG nuclease family protein [Candidatus Acidoferrales bacterium]
MSWVYVLWSEKLQKRYVGSTERSPEERLKDHNKKKTTFTARGTTWVLVHVESYPTLVEARKRESFLKTGVGRKWLDEHVAPPHSKPKSIEGSEP